MEVVRRGVYLKYEDLILEAEKEGIIVKEAKLPGYKGRIRNNRIAINKDIETQIEKSCILAEELGHFHTTYGDILNQSNASNVKQEKKARKWGYDKQVGLIGIVNAFNAHCVNIFEVAEFLGVSEEFLKEAINCYRSKYGECISIDNYIIFFEPNLAVMKLI